MSVKVALFSDNPDHHSQSLAKELVKSGFQVQVFETYEEMVKLAELGSQLQVDVAVVHLGLLMSGKKGTILRDDLVSLALPEETRRVFTGGHLVGDIKDEVIKARGDHYMRLDALWQERGIQVLKCGKTSKNERNSRGISFTTETGLSFGIESHLKTEQNEQGDGDRGANYWKK